LAANQVMTTEQVINAYYENVNKGDWDSWLTLFTDDIVIDEQLAGHSEGIKVLREGVGGLKRGYSKFLMHPVHTVVDGDKGVVIWHCEAANAAGVPIDARGANYFEMRNGRIAYMANFHDSVPFRPFLDQKLG
jgi:ketosteroid isomerase-like protein